MVANSERRFLTLPAVPPCDGVSPGALLQALVALGRGIKRCHRVLSFPTQRRIVREVVREVGVLLEFFEEVYDRDGGTAVDLPDSAIVSLSEIYVAFQKIRHLVRDCGRRGARLWVLLKSDSVSSEFRVLVRSVATALDVLPLAAIDVPVEVKESVRLVADQAWRVNFANDPADDLVSKGLRSILAQFEKEIPPDRGSMQRILNHLQIRSWTDCDKEILFLEEELGAALSVDGGLVEISLLSGLRGFVLYARSVVFEAKDSRGADSLDCIFEERIPNHLNLEEFRCPITLELMKDPVTVSTGQTYDRSSITKWLAAGNRTCPVTGAPLQTTDFVPNSTLQKLIRQLFQEDKMRTGDSVDDGRRQFSKNLLPGIPAAAGAIKQLCGFLVNKLSSGSEDEKIKAVLEIRLLSKTNVFERGCLVEAGAAPWLLDLHYSPNSSLQDGATTAVLNLSKHPMGRKAVFESEARQNAAATIFYLSSVEEYRKAIGETSEVIPALVGLLKKGSVRGKKNAAVALIRLLYYPGNHPKVLAAGAISELVDLLSSDREDLVGDCLAVLAALAEQPEGAYEILQSSAVHSLVRILISHSYPTGKEYCLSVLQHLCTAGGAKVVTLLEKVPSLVPVLRVVISEGSSRASKRASSLIRLLRQDRACPAVLPPAAQREDAVRA
ncbi:unnamed protein product [Spirodela intermedia]|uniref:RING-type E3 ubiquitin transferase n=1 Tax=Spirodela intermedia TaxID=51605 RepID=A0A7I8JMF4_SPIIN|nr:unnamed protein product [Spirodela intermedia]CAA6670652.1 unnamed protein product [Spirodela intermedia]